MRERRVPYRLTVMEFWLPDEAQDIMDLLDPGIGSFSEDGIEQVGARLYVSAGAGADKEEKFMQRIAVEVWNCLRWVHGKIALRRRSSARSSVEGATSPLR
jgi:hypothetical protein